MRAYLIRRLLLVIPTMFILTAIVFLAVRFIPGDIVDLIADTMWWEGGEIDQELLRRMLGLDVPIHVQYGRWMGDILLRGSFGESLFGGWSIGEMIAGRLPISIQLGAMAIVIGLVIALPVGVYSAIRQDTAADYVGRTAAVIGMATPNFWLGMMVMLFPAIWWGWSPPVELITFKQDPLGNLGMFFIPALILGTAMSAATMRMTRTMMLEVLRQDYITTAWSKGLKERVIIIRHAIKNAFIPVLTLIGMQLPLLIGGSVILEEIFVLPGIGRLFLEALDFRDYPVISAINLILATAVLLSALLIDMLYPYLDPRIRYK